MSTKLLFSHPPLVQNLLVGFIAEPWVTGLDFAILPPLNAISGTDHV